MRVGWEAGDREGGERGGREGGREGGGVKFAYTHTMRSWYGWDLRMRRH